MARERGILLRHVRFEPKGMDETERMTGTEARSGNLEYEAGLRVAGWNLIEYLSDIMTFRNFALVFDNKMVEK